MINGKKVVATIEARMTSTRLPGKVMMPLASRPVMAHMIERHRRSKYTDEVVVATTTRPTDDPIIALCEEMRCAYFRGSEEDVFGRMVQAGAEHAAEIQVQGMADSPLVDWRILDRCIELLEESNADCAENETVETFPLGFDVRVYRFSALQSSERIHSDPGYREHAGYSIRSKRSEFKVVDWKAEGEMLWPDLRLTLDTKEDYQLISAVYEALYPKDSDFSSEDVVRFLKCRPDLVAINSEVKQKIQSASS
jgi:spore coat polysaccharide biosynthesis protein SpsF